MKTFEEGLAQTVGTLRAWILVLSLSLIVVMGLGTYAIISTRNSINQNQAQANSAAVRANSAAARAAGAALKATEAKQLANAIQAERRASLLQNCRSQDMRNKATVAALDREEGGSAQATARLLRALHIKVRASLVQQMQHAGYAETVALINALAPYQANCQAVAAGQSKP